MTNKEYNEMLKIYLKFKRLLEKYDEILECTSLKQKEEEPILIPGDVYDDICEALGKNEIGLMGIS